MKRSFRIPRRPLAVVWLLASSGLCSPLTVAQSASVTVEPASLELAVGDTANLSASVRDSAGNPMPDGAVLFFSTSPQAVSVTPSGRVTAHRAGSHTLVALHPQAPLEDPSLQQRGDPGIRVEIVVNVAPSPLASIELLGLPSQIRVGETIRVHAIAKDGQDQPRDVRPEMRVDDEAVASVATFGEVFEGTFHAHPFYDRPRPDLYPQDASALVTGLAPGSTRLRASAGGVSADVGVEVIANPVARLMLAADRDQARTGDVVHFAVEAEDISGNTVDDPALRFALVSDPDPSRAETLGAGAPAQILADGRFVAEQAGLYTVIALSGTASASRTVRVTPRNVSRTLEFVGHAPVRDRLTSDLWVWEADDGRDYAALGTWNADGTALFFDVTDPANMERIAEVQVDARTVNDVKVSEDKKIAVITREGASNRRNGFVILDIANPRSPEILARFDEQMTGGVHNVFLYEDHVYAINNGRRWDVINIEDPKNPFRISRFEDNAPGRSVHDVWVRDGIAFQAGNSDGIILVDVGGGAMGGSPANPVEMARLPQLTGWNHAVWPFRSPSTGKFYVIAGDEAHPLNPRIPGPIISWEERSTSRAMGWIHVLEFDDMQQPKEVARYQVPEAGPHNLWIDWEQEIMYVAYFNGGLRVVDVSGELVGDLYRQGREIAKFYSDDKQGYVPNAPFVWGPQPHKGVIFFSDFHSGLWAVRLREAREGSATQFTNS